MNSSKGKGQFEDEGRFGERDGSETGRFGDRAVRRQGGSGTVRTETGDGSLSPFFVKRRQRTVPCLRCLRPFQTAPPVAGQVAALF